MYCLPTRVIDPLSPFSLVRLVALFAVAAWLPVSFSVADSPVDKSQPLELLKSDFQLCDGPAWNGSNILFVPDPKAKTLWSYRPSQKNTWTRVAQDVGGFSGAFFQLGRLYLADNGSSRIVRSTDGKTFEELAKFEDGAKPNDLVVSRSGNVYATMTKQGEVRRIDAKGNISVVASGLETPNGITLSPDGRTIYVSLYKPGKIAKAEVREDGLLGSVTPFVDIEASANGAMADGMSIDRAGNVYCACAEAVWIWDATGHLIDKITTPQRPINCTFGGQHGTELFITTFGGVYRQAMRSYGVDIISPWDVTSVNEKMGGLMQVPDTVDVRWDVTYHQVGPRKLLADVYMPKNGQAKNPAIVLVHGGGWLHGDRSRFRPLALLLAKAGYVVAAIEYRLGYEAAFPAGIQDCNAATRFFRSNAASFRIDADRIGAVGGSAGGHLVGLMATGADASSLQPANINPVSSRLKAAVVMAGPMQIASGSVAERSHPGMKSNAIDWIGKTIDDAADLYHQADAFEKISADDPPVLFITGSLDNPSRDVPSLEAFKKVGVIAQQIIHEGAKHGHWNQPDWVHQVANDIDNFLKEKL